VSSDPKYAESKFSDAADKLCIGGGDIKERLKEVYDCFHPVTPADIPNHLKADFEWIIAKLLKKPPLVARNSETIVSGAIDQTLHFMHRKTGIEIAKRIFYLRDELHKYNN
jgi:hypothetical protein